MKRIVAVGFVMLILALSLTLTGCGELADAERIARNFYAGWMASSYDTVLETLAGNVTVRENGFVILNGNAANAATAFTSVSDPTGKLYVSDSSGIDKYISYSSWSGDAAEVEMVITDFKYVRAEFDMIKSGDSWSICAINLIKP